MRILIVSEDAAMAAILSRLLQDTSVRMETAAPDASLVTTLFEKKADLLLLDLRREDGLELLGAIRESAPLCAVLVLSERASPALRALWIESGADDCLGKPFSLGELRARCRALLRRQRALGAVLCLQEEFGGIAARERRQEPDRTLALGSLELDRVRRRAVCEGLAVRLTDRETALLGELMLAHGTVVSREVLRGAFADPDGRNERGPEAMANVVDVHISAVRKKLRRCAAAPRIETVRGAGYRMMTPHLPALARPSLFGLQQ